MKLATSLSTLYGLLLEKTVKRRAAAVADPSVTARLPQMVQRLRPVDRAEPIEQLVLDTAPSSSGRDGCCGPVVPVSHKVRPSQWLVTVRDDPASPNVYIPRTRPPTRAPLSRVLLDRLKLRRHIGARGIWTRRQRIENKTNVGECL